MIKYRKLILVSFLIVFVIIISIANSQHGKSIFSFVRDIPGGDTSAHFILFALFSLAVNIYLDFRYFAIQNKKILLGSTIVFLIATIEEFSQIWMQSRVFDLSDLAADTIGIYFISWLAFKKYLKIVKGNRFGN